MMQAPPSPSAASRWAILTIRGAEGVGQGKSTSGSGGYDCYCEVKLSSRRIPARLTEIIQRTTSPSWNATFDLGKIKPKEEIEIGCWHKAPWWLDEFLGKIVIKLDDFTTEGQFAQTRQMVGRAKRDIITGTMTFEIEIFHTDPKLNQNARSGSFTNNNKQQQQQQQQSSTPSPSSLISSSASALIPVSSATILTSPSTSTKLSSSASFPSTMPASAGIKRSSKDMPTEQDRVSIVARLGFWLVRRPTVVDLEEAGILPMGPNRMSTTVFGKPLDLLVERESSGLQLNMDKLVKSNEQVPMLLIKAVNILRDRNAVTSEGLFRVGGCALRLQKMIEDINKGVPVDLEQEPDVNVIASLIKAYLRELPNPLLTFELYDQWLASVEKPTPKEQFIEIKRLVFALPEPNRAVLKLLLPFFNEVVQNEATNRMNAFALAIVISPNMLWSQKRVAIDFRAVQNINDITVVIITCHAYIFGDWPGEEKLLENDDGVAS
jgi:hypothetical protein